MKELSDTAKCILWAIGSVLLIIIIVTGFAFLFRATEKKCQCTTLKSTPSTNVIPTTDVTPSTTRKPPLTIIPTAGLKTLILYRNIIPENFIGIDGLRTEDIWYAVRNIINGINDDNSYFLLRILKVMATLNTSQNESNLNEQSEDLQNATNVCLPRLLNEIRQVEDDVSRKYYNILYCAAVCFIDELKISLNEKKVRLDIRNSNVFDKYKLAIQDESKCFQNIRGETLVEISSIFPSDDHKALKKIMELLTNQFKQIEQKGLQTYLIDRLKNFVDVLVDLLSNVDIEGTIKSLNALLNKLNHTNADDIAEELKSSISKVNGTIVYKEVKAQLKKSFNSIGKLNINFDNIESAGYHVFIDITVSLIESVPRQLFRDVLQMIIDWLSKSKTSMENLKNKWVTEFEFHVELCRELGVFVYLEAGIKQIGTVFIHQQEADLNNFTKVLVDELEVLNTTCMDLEMIFIKKEGDLELYDALKIKRDQEVRHCPRRLN